MTHGDPGSICRRPQTLAAAGSPEGRWRLVRIPDSVRRLAPAPLDRACLTNMILAGGGSILESWIPASAPTVAPGPCHSAAKPKPTGTKRGTAESAAHGVGSSAASIAAAAAAAAASAAAAAAPGSAKPDKGGRKGKAGGPWGEAAEVMPRTQRALPPAAQLDPAGSSEGVVGSAAVGERDPPTLAVVHPGLATDDRCVDRTWYCPGCCLFAVLYRPFS